MGKLIYLEGQLRARLPYEPEKEALPRLGERLAPLFDPAPVPDQAGLYLASGNAGFLSSLLFWSDAQRQGIAVANPELFPWTLANAPCGWLARQFQITGPNFTYTGRAEALAAALQQAAEHLVAGRIETAWVVALDFAQAPGQRTTLAALRLGGRPGPFQLCALPPSRQETGRRAGAAAALSRFIRGLERGQAASHLSDGVMAFGFQASSVG